MWFKETYRILAANPRLPLFEQGLLWNLCRFAWDKQGIVESDLQELARALREPVTAIQNIWEDFKCCAEEREGKWMLPEQWEGVKNYAQKITSAKIGGQASAKSRLLQIKDLRPTHAQANLKRKAKKRDFASTDLDLDLENTKKIQSKSHSRAVREQGEIERKDNCYASFLQAYQLSYASPYLGKAADFIQFWKLHDKSRAANWEITPERWQVAQRHYLCTPQGEHTFADLCAKFSTFYRSPLDRFGKPIEHNGVNNGIATTRTESAEERRLREFAEDLGAIAPTAEVGDHCGNGPQTQGASGDGAIRTDGYIDIVGTRLS